MDVDQDFHKAKERLGELIGSICQVLKLRGLKSSDIERALVVDKSLVSRWTNGSTVGLERSSRRIAWFAAECMETREQSDIYLAFLLLDAHRSLVKPNPNAELPNSLPISDCDWIELLIALETLNDTTSPKAWRRSFESGNRFWDAAEFGRKVPEVLRYELRARILDAKTKLKGYPMELDDFVNAQTARIGLGVGQQSLKGLPLAGYSSADIISIAPWLESYIPLATRGSNRELIHHPQINEKLLAGEADDVTIKRAHLTKVYEVPKRWREFCRLALSEKLRGPSDLFDAPKVRMYSPELMRAFSQKELLVEKTSYFASLVTTWSTKLEYADPNGGSPRRLWQGPVTRDDLLNLSNHLGIMSLVVSRDSMVMAAYQSGGNQISPGKWAPYGGSVDWLDLESEINTSARVSLGRLMISTIDREVVEECQLGKRVPLRSILTGHTLDIANGLKPDFFAVTIVDADAETIRSKHEPIYGGVSFGGALDFSSKEGFVSSVNAMVQKIPSAELSEFLDAAAYFMCLSYGKIKQVRKEMGLN